MSSAIESPCIKQCKLNEHRVCTGCLRSAGEIMGWYEFNDDQKSIVLAKAAKRKQVVSNQLQNLSDILEKRILDYEKMGYSDYIDGKLNESAYILKVVKLMIRDSTQSK